FRQPEGPAGGPGLGRRLATTIWGNVCNQDNGPPFRVHTLPLESSRAETTSHFWADRIEDVDELAGEWKTLTWMMVGSSRKKVQVGSAEGTWSVQRTQQAKATPVARNRLASGLTGGSL
ncbi:MAG: hypothetical protein WA996_23700, partial [Candidatus Promineifilaceae bacterium]